MNKFLINISIALSLLAFGQRRLHQGAWTINAGTGYCNWGIPVYVGFDHGVHRDFTIGAEFAFRHHTDKWRGDGTFPATTYGHSIASVLFNGNYHFNTLLNIPEEWDLYAGANVGYLYAFYDENYIDRYGESYYNHSHATGLGFGLQAGARLYFTNRLGMHFEVGGGNVINGIKLGLTVKLQRQR